MKTILGFIAAVFFLLPVAMGAQLVLSTMAMFGYLNATVGQNATLVSSALMLAQLYAGGTPTYTNIQQQDFVVAWKAYLDAFIPNLKTSFGVAVPDNYIGPFLTAADAKLQAYYPPTA